MHLFVHLMRFVCGAALPCSCLYVQVQANANLMDERASLGISWEIITRHKNVSPDWGVFWIPDSGAWSDWDRKP